MPTSSGHNVVAITRYLDSVRETLLTWHELLGWNIRSGVLPPLAHPVDVAGTTLAVTAAVEMPHAVESV